MIISEGNYKASEFENCIQDSVYFSIQRLVRESNKFPSDESRYNC